MTEYIYVKNLDTLQIVTKMPQLIITFFMSAIIAITFKWDVILL